MQTYARPVRQSGGVEPLYDKGLGFLVLNHA